MSENKACFRFSQTQIEAAFGVLLASCRASLPRQINNGMRVREPAQLTTLWIDYLDNSTSRLGRRAPIASGCDVSVVPEQLIGAAHQDVGRCIDCRANGNTAPEQSTVGEKQLL